MDIDYNTLTDLAGADGHNLNLNDYFWSVIDDYSRSIFYGIENMFGSVYMNGAWCLPSIPLSIAKKHFNAVWPDYERKTIL